MVILRWTWHSLPLSHPPQYALHVVMFMCWPIFILLHSSCFCRPLSPVSKCHFLQFPLILARCCLKLLIPPFSSCEWYLEQILWVLLDTTWSLCSIPTWIMFYAFLWFTNWSWIDIRLTKNHNIATNKKRIKASSEKFRAHPLINKNSLLIEIENNQQKSAQN